VKKLQVQPSCEDLSAGAIAKYNYFYSQHLSPEIAAGPAWGQMLRILPVDALP
jgi:hypothetical protein